MDAISTSSAATPSRLSTRRATLERQSSVEAGTIHREGTSGSSVSASRSPNSDQSAVEKNLDPPPLTQSQSFDSQTLPMTPSMDKSPGALQMSKAGRKRKHPAKPGKHICPYCSRPCAKPSVLEKHIRMHTGERPYPCDACDLSFKTKSNLYKHRKSFTHMQKCKEKGLSMESSYGESFGSSRDESMDIEGDEDNQLSHLGYRRASSMGGSIDLSRKGAQSPYSMRQPSYMETLQHLEQVYDVIDTYAKKMGTVVSKHEHWMIDKDCIVSVQLQHPPPLPAVNGSSHSAVTDNRKPADGIPSTAATSTDDVQLRITNLLKANAEIVGSASTDMPRRRLSRQHSVSSPAVQMFNSTSSATSSAPNLPVQYACSGVSDVGHKLPDGEELLRQIRQVIHLNSNIDSNIKLLMHKHCMEVKMRLFVPDLAARRKFGQGFLASLSEQKQGQETENTHQRFTCTSCGQGFNREHILEIHSAFYCHVQLSAVDNHSSMRAAPGQSEEGNPAENKKMKLLKTGSEESYTYVIADERCNNRLARQDKLPTSDLVSRHRSLSVQQSSTETGPECHTTIQQLKKHVLKHMSQGSVGADTVDDSAAVTGCDGVSKQETSDNVAVPVSDALLPTVIVDDVDVPVTQAGSKPSTPHPPPTYANLTKVQPSHLQSTSSPHSTTAELSVCPPPQSPVPPTTWSFAPPISRHPSTIPTVVHSSGAIASPPAAKKGETTSSPRVTPTPSHTADVTTSGVGATSSSVPGAVQRAVDSAATPAKLAKIAACPPVSAEGVVFPPSPATMIHIAPANNATTATLPANAGVNAVHHVASPLLGPKPMLLAAPQAWKGVPSIALVAPSGSTPMPGASSFIIAPLPPLVSSPRILPRRSSVKPILPAEPTTPGMQLLAPKSERPAPHRQPHSVFHFGGATRAGGLPVRSETERVSALRRRFSQSRSKSSVSFEEPPVKQTVTLSTPMSSGCGGTPQTSTVTVNTPAKAAGEPDVQTASAIVSRGVAVASQVTASTALSSPRPSHAYSPGSLGAIETSTTQGPQQRTVCKSSRSVDCQLTYCTVHARRLPCEGRAATSKYLSWSPSKPPVSASLFLDMAVPLSLYRSKQKLSPVSYTNSSVDTRSIYTHSSYWKYKNKMRVMHSMPSKSISSTLATAQSANQDTPVSKAPTSCTTETGITIVVSTCVSVTAEISPVISVNSNALRPSVITRDYQSKKKILHRSQSTPNAGDETQSKLIAGGFKSDEDYVYIRGRGKGKFVCQQCGIRCRKPSMLKKHIRTHTDLRPYSCKHCNFSFKTKGNLTKHMRSKAHHRRCLELHIVPVPLTVDDSQIDLEVLASQQKLSRESKIKGAKFAEDDEDMDGSDSEDHSSDDEDDEEDSSSDDSSGDDALHIDESSDEASQLDLPNIADQQLSLNSASLRRVQSMPAHHMSNSFDASSLADMLPEEPKPIQPLPPPKKRKRNHLNLTISTASAQKSESPSSHANSSNIEDDIAMSLLDLSKTPVHGTPTAVKESSLPVQQVQALQTPKPIDAQRVSVVRSTKSVEVNNFVSQDEPIDLRVQTKSSQLKFICPLCRAICSNQDLLNAHMKLHDGPVIEVANKSMKKQMSKNRSLGSSTDQDGALKPAPQTPNTLKRQHAISAFDSDADDDDDVDSFTKVEPRDMVSEKLMKRKCPYCPKVFHNDSSLPQHIKVHHLITQEYVCTYKDCGNKFTNKQDLTYHLGTHALDDNDKYQPISIPKCGICEKTFKSMSSLKQHLQHHSEARPHVCEYCDAGFTTAQSLKHHLKTHTQERPYVCGECGSTFARSDHLTQHTKIHKKHIDSGSRPAPLPPTILNAAGAESHSHCT